MIMTGSSETQLMPNQLYEPHHQDPALNTIVLE